MHTTKLKAGWVAIHDGQPQEQDDIIFFNEETKAEYKLPYYCIKLFMAEQIRNSMIKAIEEAEPDQLFACITNM